MREGARYYLIGASFWELDWEQALFYFDQVYRGWTGLWDGTMTASERFHFASMRYADQLFGQGQYCDAVAQYQNAQAIAPLDELAADGFEEAYIACFPPTETITPTLEVTPTLGGPTIAPTDTPPGAPPTETLTPAPPAKHQQKLPPLLLHDHHPAHLGAGAHILVTHAGHRHMGWQSRGNFVPDPPRHEALTQS